MRNSEVQRACEELLDLAASWPRENVADVRLPPDGANVFRDYCSRSMYQSLLSAVKSSFSLLKARLGSTAVGGVLFLERPVFGVDLQLRVPSVVLHPSLDEIQEAINTTAKKVRGQGGAGFVEAGARRGLLDEVPEAGQGRAACAGRQGQTRANRGGLLYVTFSAPSSANLSCAESSAGLVWGNGSMSNACDLRCARR